jgi:hypothetical protein
MIRIGEIGVDAIVICAAKGYTGTGVGNGLDSLLDMVRDGSLDRLARKLPVRKPRETPPDTCSSFVPPLLPNLLLANSLPSVLTPLFDSGYALGHIVVQVALTAPSSDSVCLVDWDKCRQYFSYPHPQCQNPIPPLPWAHEERRSRKLHWLQFCGPKPNNILDDTDEAPIPHRFL